MMNFRLLETKYLVDISGLASLAYIREASSEIEIGAAETQANVLAWPKLAKSLPLLSLAMPHIGHFQTRSRGTVCGSIATFRIRVRSCRFAWRRLGAAWCCSRLGRPACWPRTNFKSACL